MVRPDRRRPRLIRSGADARDVVTTYPVVTLKDQGQFTDELKGTVDQVLLLSKAMLALSMLIALLGIVNTLALAVIERTREIGLPRAMGMARGQVRRMIRLESVIISLYGATLGLVLGVVLASALAGQGITVLSVPYGRLLLFLTLTLTLALAGVMGCSRRYGPPDGPPARPGRPRKLREAHSGLRRSHMEAVTRWARQLVEHVLGRSAVFRLTFRADGRRPWALRVVAAAPRRARRRL